MKPPARDGNLVLLRRICVALGPLLEEVALVGGCATALLISDEAAPDVRPTLDVDVIVRAGSRTEYHRFEQLLVSRGFRHPVPGGSNTVPICRWEIDKAVVDFMPTDPLILGFGNRWAEEALSTSRKVALDENLVVRVVMAPYFLAMKTEAFQGRGEGDFFVSPDMEDIVSVVDGRPELVEEIKSCSEALRTYLSDVFGQYLRMDDFREAVPGYLPTDPASRARLPILFERFKRIADM